VVINDYTPLLFVTHELIDWKICPALTLFFSIVQATTVPVGAFVWISKVPPIIRAR
jgi:hypothetical protein